MISNFESLFVDKFFPGNTAFSFWKGRVALYAILKALDIKSGDEVILPGYTCVVVPNAVKHLGASIKYVDNSNTTFHLDPSKVEDTISSKTKAIIIQHTYGIPGPVDEILTLSKKYGIPIIEDCAHALGSKANGKLVGNYGLASFFSSQWSKTFTTGLGGLAITSDIEFANKLDKVHKSMISPPKRPIIKLRMQYLIFKNFYTPKIYWQAQELLRVFSKLGLFVGSSSDEELEGAHPSDHNWKMSDYQKCAGVQNLEIIKQNLSHREDLVNFYDNFMDKNLLPKAFRIGKTNFLRYPLRVTNKPELLYLAKKEQISIGSWFETPLHPVSLDKHHIFDYQLGQCPNAEKDSREVINLPLDQWTTFEDANNITSFISKYAIFEN
jgi:dTDP-4-amino-4,6-dideoxygalactose transaminase